MYIKFIKNNLHIFIKISKTINMFRNFFYLKDDKISKYFKSILNWKIVIIGLFAGVVSGLFASGGGMILVPAFMYLLNMRDVESRATSVICILPMVVTSGIFYYKNHYIDWKIGVLCAIGGIVGGIVGAKLLNRLPTKYLKIAFTIFLIYASYKMIR